MKISSIPFRRSIIQAICWLVIAVGLLVMAGWTFHVEALKNVFPDLPTMKVNTALCFVFSGLSLLFYSVHRDSKALNARLGLFLALLVFATGAATLAEYVFHLNFGIDELLFRDVASLTLPIFPGRMSPITAVNFSMIGLFLAFLRSQKRFFIELGQYLVMLTLSISIVSFLGFIYEIREFYAMTYFTGLAFHTMVGFILLSFGLLLVLPDGLSAILFGDRLGSTVGRRFSFLIIILFPLIGWLMHEGAELGYFDLDKGISMMVSSLMFLSYLILWKTVLFVNQAETARLEREKIIVRLEKEKDLEQSKEEFVSLASHQLRTPLTAIRGFSDLMLENHAGILTPKQREYINDISHSNKRMIDLVNALLNTSRIDLGVFAIEPEPCDPVALARVTVRELKIQTEAKQLKLMTHFKDDLRDMKLDPRLTKIIFENLLTNAIKYTPDGGRIDFTMRLEGPFLRISVSDTGIGIPAGQKDKIFTKLFRADNAQLQNTDGTGLGLYIVKAIVEASKGKISFSSTEKLGTEFIILLPRRGMPRRHGAKGLS